MKALRSREVGVQVTVNRNGSFINVRVDSTPYTTLGPYKDNITIAEALHLVATEVRLNHLLENDSHA